LKQGKESSKREFFNDPPVFTARINVPNRTTFAISGDIRDLK
jgi:hypothetical protein